MLWRNPWLRQRIALIGCVAWDIGALYGIYSLSYLLRLGTWEWWSYGLLIVEFTWVAVSYLVGRYSSASGMSKKCMARLTIEAVVPASAVILLFVGHAWLFQINDAQTRFRGFLIPVTALSIALSVAYQYMVRRHGRKSGDSWVVLGSSCEEEVLLREIRLRGGAERSIEFVNTEMLSGSETEQIGIGRSVALGKSGLSDKSLVETLLRMKSQGTYVVPIVNWCEEQLQRIPPELVSREWLVQADGFALRPGTLGWRIKRFGDILGATVLLGLTSPIIAIAAIMIWLEDRGPVFYSQIRTGLYAKEIRVWKLRSMRINAESAGIQWARKDDPRVTRVGKLIRRSRIDELPQLFNVLYGDLSLIGPRPERPEIEDHLEMEIPHYRVRHWIRPGLSGWAQVCYPYGASVGDSRTKLSYDIYYLRNSNILLDALVTIKTIKLVLRGEGASPLTPPQKDDI